MKHRLTIPSEPIVVKHPYASSASTSNMRGNLGGKSLTIELTIDPKNSFDNRVRFKVEQVGNFLVFDTSHFALALDHYNNL